MSYEAKIDDQTALKSIAMDALTAMRCWGDEEAMAWALKRIYETATTQIYGTEQEGAADAITEEGRMSKPPQAKPCPLCGGATEVPEGLQDDVFAFAKMMQNKLDKNTHKNGWPDYDEDGNRAWGDVDSDFLKAKLLEEVGELFMEFCAPQDNEELVKEAADIGNLAMMLASQNGLQRIAAPDPQEGQG